MYYICKYLNIMTTSKIVNCSIYLQWSNCKISTTIITQFDKNPTHTFTQIVQLKNVNLVKMFWYKKFQCQKLDWAQQIKVSIQRIKTNTKLQDNTDWIWSKPNIKTKYQKLNWTVLQQIKIQYIVSKQVQNWLNSGVLKQI